MAVDGPDPRSNSRANVFLMAVVRMGAGSFPVRVRNLSARGALLEAAKLPAAGEKARVLRGSLCATGEVAWKHQKHCGIRFDQPIDVEEWVKRAGPQTHPQVDAGVSQSCHDKRSAMPLPEVSVGTRNDTFEEAGEDLLEICERISGMPDMTIQLSEELLKIAAIAQALKKPRCERQ